MVLAAVRRTTKEVDDFTLLLEQRFIWIKAMAKDSSKFVVLKEWVSWEVRGSLCEKVVVAGERE